MTRARVLQLGNLAFWLLVAVASIRYVLPKWREFGLSSRLPALDLGWVAGATLALALQYLAVFALWCAVLRLFGAQAPARTLYRAFGLSLLPKYVPGKVFGPGVRTGLTVGAGISYPAAVGSLVWEIGLALASAAAITLLGLALGVSRNLEPAARWLLPVFPLAVAIGLAVLRIPRVREFARTWLHLGVALRQRAAVARVFLGYGGAWLLYAAAHWMIARAITPFPADQAFPLLVALCASWALGVLTVFAPAGLGVREGALFLFARGPMGVPDALLFVTLSRLVIFGVETLLTFTAALMPVARTGADIRAADAPPS